MNKLKTLLLACSLLSIFASCISDPERHELSPVGSSIILYADHTVDSLQFYTFDSWTVTPKDNWITVDGDSHMDLDYNYSIGYLCKVFLKIQPNTTGKTRCGTVLVQSYKYSYSSPFVQLGILKITHPAYTADTWLDEQSGIPEVAHFELVDSAHWTSDSICFTVQNNWDLVFDGEPAEWLTLDKTTDLKGKYKVYLTLVPNTDTEEGRSTKLKLTCNGVTNEIVVRQLPAKKEEE